MRIEEMIWQNRRDFKAVFVCEHCAAKTRETGYDDAYFHKTVIPGMKCPNCGKTAPGTYQPRETKYPEGMQV